MTARTVRGPCRNLLRCAAGTLVWMAVAMACVALPRAVQAAGHSVSEPEVTWTPADLCQGGVVRIQARWPQPVRSVSGRLLDKRIFFNPNPERTQWWSLVGIDLDQEAGPVLLTLRADDSIHVQRMALKQKSYGERKFTIRERPPDEETLERIRREQDMVAALWEQVTPECYWRKPFIRPVPGRVTGIFGVDTYINGHKRSPHSGVDLSVKKDKNIRCSNDGVVALAADMYYAGKSLFVDHGQGVYTMYFHMERFLVRQGERVRRGQVLGYAGSTGRSTGPHLHWGVRINGARVSPMQLLEQTRDVAE